MTAWGFSVLGAAFWDELDLLRETERSWPLLEETRRMRLCAVLRQGGYATVGREPEDVLRTVEPARRADLRAPGWALGRRTSGSTGRAVEISVGRRAYAKLLAAFWRALEAWKVAPGEAGLALLGSGAGPVRLLLLRGKDRALGVRRVFVDDGEAWVAEARRLLRRFRFSYVYGYPSALYELAARGFELRCAPRVVVGTGEPLFWFQRKWVSAAFAAPVVEEFGCTEVGAVAFECARGSLHLVAEQVWLESTPAGSLATSLVRRPLPLLRYPLDEPMAVEGGECGCGRCLPRVALLRRRSTVWRLFEECTQVAAQQGRPPGRFVITFDGTWTVRVQEEDRAQAKSLLEAFGRRAGEVRLLTERRLHRRSAGKFRYLEASEW